MVIVATWKVLLLGFAFVGAAIYTHVSEVPCPLRYKLLEKDGGELQNEGDIVRYCNLDYEARWVLKDEYKKSDMER